MGSATILKEAIKCLFCQCQKTITRQIFEYILTTEPSATVVVTTPPITLPSNCEMSPSFFRGPDIQDALPDFRPNTSVLKIIQENLRRDDQRIALIDGDTGETVNSSQLLQQSCRIAAGLQASGVSPGDVVVICSDKSILSFSLLLGVMFSGATAVLTPPPHADTLDEMTSGATVKAVFYDPAFSESVSQSVARMTPAPSLVAKVVPEDTIMASLLKSTEEIKVFQVEDIRNHVPVVFFSSGTTGYPKGVEISDLGAQLSGILFQHRPKSLLHASPLYWYSALAVFIGSILLKYTLVMTNSKDALYRLRIIEKYKVASFFCNNASMNQYLNEPTIDNFDLTSVQRVLVGGETVLSSVARKFFTRFLEGRASMATVYGCTEAGVISSLEVQDADSIVLGACGKPAAGVEVKITDDNGDLVESGAIGRVWVKSAATKGYWRRDDLNRNFLDPDGFYETGDAGIIDAEGNIYLRGRKSDLINFRGIKNSPAVVEDVLMGHPAIQEVVVVGKSHPSDIQHPTAFVVLRPKYRGSVTDSDIVAYVDDKVEEGLRLRGGVHFRDTLTRVFNGKLVRNIDRI